MIKTKAVMEIKTGENVYTMECPSSANLGEVHDALLQMQGIVLELMKKNQEKIKDKADESVEVAV